MIGCSLVVVDLAITSGYFGISQCKQGRTYFFLIVVVFVLFSSAVSSESSLEEGWDTEDIEIPDEDLPSEQTRSAKTLMDEAKAGHVEELQPPFKVT